MGFFLIVKKHTNNALSAAGRFFLNDKKLLLFLFFLVISSGFWFLNALRKSYVTDISYTAEFYNFPNDKTMGEKAPKNLKLRVKGTGYILLRYYLGKGFYPLLFDVAHMRRISSGNKTGAVMEQRQLMALVRSQLSNDIELLEVAPATVELWFQNKATKKVPVVFKGNLGYNQPYHQSGKVELTPDSVQISGVESVVDSISFIETEYLEMMGIQDSLSTVVSLVFPNDIEVSDTKAKVLVPVEAFTEAAVDVPIIVVGAPYGIIIKTFPAEIKVSYRIGLSRFESIRSDSFTALVDVFGVDFTSQKKLKVKLDIMPNFIYAIDYSPLFVDFLIENPNLQ